MQSKIKGKSNIQKPEYPCLKVFIDEENGDYNKIVLFTAQKTGIVVHAYSFGNFIGEYYDKWDEELFQPFNGTIELSN